MSLGATRVSAQSGCPVPLDSWTLLDYQTACMSAGYTSIISGTGGDDLLNGTGGRDCMIGFDGDDTVNGGNGADCIYGGNGADTINGGNDGDFIWGGAGNDTLNGQAGNDYINGGAGDDNITGDNGIDVLDGGSGTDNVNGGAGNDVCQGESIPLCEALTYATLGSVDAVSVGGVPTLRFTTTGEAGTQGFEIARLDGAEWVRVGPELVSALIGEPQGGTYYVADSELTAGSFYRITEVEVDGDRRDLGAHAVILGGSASVALVGGVAAVAHPLEAVSVARPKAGDLPDTAPVALYLGVDATGVYRVTMEQVAAGLELGLAEARAALAASGLALSVQGQPVAWWADEAGDTLYFYGEARSSLYIADNLYRLALGDGARVRTAAASAASGGEDATSRETVRAERDVTPVTVINPAADSDFWFWQYVAAGGSADFPITLPEPTTAGEVQLAVELHGATTRDTAGEHSATLLLNGSPAGSFAFEGIVPRTITLSVDASALVDGVNTLRITGTGAAHSIVWVDAVSASYTRHLANAGSSVGFGAGRAGSVVVAGLSDGDVHVLDVSHPRAPVLLTGLTPSDDGGSFSVRLAAAAGARYVAAAQAGVRSPRITVDHASNLRGARGAEYVVIAPREVFSGARALADYRAEHGLSAMLVDLADVYDEFAFGTPDPHAIRAFLAHASTNWSTPPRYVVLAGAGTYDYRDLRGLGGNLVPALMVNTPNGLFASDGAIADFAGDARPDLLLGRLPVTSNEALQAFVTRLAAYEAGLEQQSDRAFFMAGAVTNEPFNESTDALATIVGALSEAGLVEQLYRSDLTLELARTRLFDALAEGVFWVNYIGHGSLDSFSGDGVLTVADVPALVAAEPAIFTNMTCTSSRFEVPGRESFGEALSNSSAAIGVWGATGLSVNTYADFMVQAFARGVYGDAPTLGDAIDGAYTELAAEPEWDAGDMLAIYHLLGDPATRLKDRHEAPIIIPPTDAGTDRPLPVDGGTGADLGAGADAGTPMGGGGCSAAHGQTSLAPFLLAFSLVGLLARRRRR